ncbi:MoxR-like ATPase [Paenibacillus shirakamiensis]|uniref:MoxR-like ATPase n=1 Tax=Paenibacillus shirakamiensis TaxID=1265935 RepID=A0ABS4JJ43_9BACL|nr:MoxR family ATPase [Paenibacillus shirakamiensis]MBP2001726.1 MoxR-like ATPase [Paenibacillus shirakamiensis]
MLLNSSYKISHEQAVQLLKRLVRQVDQVVMGKRLEIEMVLIAMLQGGHVLLEDIPGVGKTTLVRTIAAALGCSFGRIQFTSDLMPSDITGVSVYHPLRGEFEFRPGPILSHLVLADEMNRAAPRTQSALLEAMEEKRVTVDGVSYELPKPFLLLATQNPLQFEGTYKLPEAQLDRFLMRLSLGYPALDEEVLMLEHHQEGSPLEGMKPILLAEEMVVIQHEVRRVIVDEKLKRYMVSLADASRRHSKTLLGISPRGTLAWMGAAQAAAYYQGRMYVIPDDIKKVANYVLPHRILLSVEARIAGIDPEELVREWLRTTPVPMSNTRATS